MVKANKVRRLPVGIKARRSVGVKKRQGPPSRDG